MSAGAFSEKSAGQYSPRKCPAGKRPAGKRPPEESSPGESCRANGTLPSVFQCEKPKALFLPSLPEKGSGGGIKQENAVGVVLQDGSRTHGGDFALYGIFNSLRF